MTFKIDSQIFQMSESSKSLKLHIGTACSWEADCLCRSWDTHKMSAIVIDIQDLKWCLKKDTFFLYNFKNACVR